MLEFSYQVYLSQGRRQGGGERCNHTPQGAIFALKYRKNKAKLGKIWQKWLIRTPPEGESKIRTPPRGGRIYVPDLSSSIFIIDPQLLGKTKIWDKL